MGKKFLIITIIIIAFSNQLFSEDNPINADKWSYSFYKNISCKTFRKQNIFNKTIDVNNVDYPLLNAAVFFAANEQRIKYGKEPLEFAIQLEISAWVHSKNMQKYNFFSHTDSRKSSRRDPSKRGGLAGIENPKLAENIAYNYIQSHNTYLDIADKFIISWMNSPGHKRNILSGKAFQMGCGLFVGRPWASNRSFIKVYGTQNFQWFYKIIPGEAVDKGPCPTGCE